jgi:hypothetical protein
MPTSSSPSAPCKFLNRGGPSASGGRKPTTVPSVGPPPLITEDRKKRRVFLPSKRASAGYLRRIGNKWKKNEMKMKKVSIPKEVQDVKITCLGS